MTCGAEQGTAGRLTFELRHQCEGCTAAAACLLLQLAFVYLPPLQAVFGTTALGAREWVGVGAAGLGVFVVAELEKAAARALIRQGAPG